jgi:hypothetical protein
VTHHLPSPRQGLTGRPPVAVAGSPGVFIAGDWVGSEGWLADCSLTSGERAGMLAACTRGMNRPARGVARVRSMATGSAAVPERHS